MSATRYLGDRTRIVVTWKPRRPWDAPWVQGSYDLVFYDATCTWEIPDSRVSAADRHHPARVKRHTTRRSGDLNIAVARAERWGGGEGRPTSLRDVVTLGDLGLVRPEIPFYVDEKGERHIYDERDLAPSLSGNHKGCRSHEDCRGNRALARHCGEEQLACMRAEDAIREKLLGTPQAIDTIVRVILTRIANLSRQQLGRDWFDTEGVRDDLAKYGVLALRRTESKPKGRSAGLAPMRVFHGTRHARRILENGFSPSATGEFGPGIYFSTFEPTASFYASRVASGPEAPVVLLCEVALEKPFHTTKAEYLRLTERSTPRTVQARLMRQGFDGIVGVGLNGVDVQVVAFYPAQIRACRRV